MSITRLGAFAAKSAVLRGLVQRVFRRPANAVASIFARQGAWLPVTAFVLLFLAALLLMVWLSLNYETNRRQSQLELDVTDAAATIQGVLLRDAQTFQLQGLGASGTSEFLAATPRLLVERPEIVLLERRLLARHGGDIPEDVVSAWSNHPTAKVLSTATRLSPEAAIPYMVRRYFLAPILLRPLKAEAQKYLSFGWQRMAQRNPLRWCAWCICCRPS
jgi:hypothetical protein